MPMQGITVEGSDWKLYLSFVRDTQLVGVHLLTLSKRVHIKSNYAFQIMMDPLKMGSTNYTQDTFKIVYMLYILMKWGKTEYNFSGTDNQEPAPTTHCA